ncbi:hypothetical protein QQF64_015519 [Cirrhinus molitorella]|uniref:Fibronectin type-III domain-containing protein n=1 Tax=Cirrhinus molitorella TaxID=172907 RepID=A0ABR3NV54_9TELE
MQIKPPDHGVSFVNSYCISYQSAQSSEWTEVFTDGVSDQVTIKQLQPHTEYCFACKAVCRPGVSLTSDPTSFFRTLPCAPPGAPTIKQVESESATVVWDVPASVGEDVLITGYVLEFRECTKDQENEKPWKSVKSTNRECTLHGLKEDTIYTVRVFANCGNDGMSLPSPETAFSAHFKGKESNKNGSALFLNQSSRIKRGNPSIHSLELHKKLAENESFNQYVFGRKVEDVKNKVILFLGATGAGKTTLINVMANYILGVKWQDAYRFKLINEVTNRTQAESQTSNVSSFELYNQPGFQIPYSLTIIDTPGFGDTRGIEHDKLISEQIKSFLCSPLGIDHIDAVCFVVQASLPRLSANQKYIFDSILSIFGKDIAENIIIMVTFADGKDIPVLEAIKAADLPCQKNKKGQPTHFNFNNSAVYTDKKPEEHTTPDKDSDDDDDDDEEDKLTELVWDKTFKQMKAFFKTLEAIESKDLTLTIKVLEERERLEKAMASLTPQITAGLSKLSEIKKFKQCLENESENMAQNENFEQEVEVMKANRTPVNCLTMMHTCFTCHSNCFLPAEDPVQTCAVMENDHCIICTENCHYSAHSRENFMWTYETKIETKTIKELKDNFMAAKGKFMNTKQMLDALEKELRGIEDKLMKLVILSSDCLRKLDEIALKPKSLSTSEYLEILIKSEKDEKSPGFEDRTVGLEKMKQETLILEKIAKGENLLEKDHSFTVERETNEDCYPENNENKEGC